MVSWACLGAAKAVLVVLVVPLALVAPLVRAAVELASTLAVLVVPSAQAVLVVVLVVLLL
jgi:hypothetical protein